MKVTKPTKQCIKPIPFLTKQPTGFGHETTDIYGLWDIDF